MAAETEPVESEAEEIQEPVKIVKKKPEVIIKKKKAAVIKKTPVVKEPKIIKKTTVKKVKKKPVTKKKEPVKKKEVKKKKVNPLDEAMKKMEKKVAADKEREKTITNQKKPPEKSKKTITASGSGQGTGINADGDTPGGGKLATILSVYKSNIGVDIERGWAFPENLAGLSGKLTAEIKIEVYPNGELKRADFIKKSGNKYLDESAMNAVLKATPLMPHPDGVIKPYVTIRMRFTPPES